MLIVLLLTVAPILLAEIYREPLCRWLQRLAAHLYAFADRLERLADAREAEGRPPSPWPTKLRIAWREYQAFRDRD